MAGERAFTPVFDRLCPAMTDHLVFVETKSL